MSASIDITSFLRGLAKADQQVKDRARRALDAAGEHVLGKAKERTPYDTGALQKSATAEKAEWRDTGNLVKTIGFNTTYAAAVHENWQPTKRVTKTKTITRPDGKKRRQSTSRGNRNEQARAKFLEMALREEATKVAEFIQKAVGQ